MYRIVIRISNVLFVGCVVSVLLALSPAVSWGRNGWLG
jgi:hypothetical protein